MSGAKSPRGEQPGRPGAQWEDPQFVLLGQVISPEDNDESPFGWAEFQPEDRASRAVRRAAAREARRATSAPSRTPRGPQKGTQP